MASWHLWTWVDRGWQSCSVLLLQGTNCRQGLQMACETDTRCSIRALLARGMHGLRYSGHYAKDSRESRERLHPLFASTPSGFAVDLVWRAVVGTVASSCVSVQERAAAVAGVGSSRVGVGVGGLGLAPERKTTSFYENEMSFVCKFSH